jgi:hypothetical protein
MLKKLFSLLIVSSVIFSAVGQELNCKVKVQHNAIQNVDKQVFTTMEKSITDFMNMRKWTTDEFGINEKIDVNILINLTARTPEEEIYTGTFNIQASRPVFNSSYNSPTVNFIDRDFMFRYNQFTPLQFDDNRVSGSDAMASNLTAVLAFYAYIILGLDYDSFSPEGGAAFLKRAQNVVSNAPEEGGGIPGWKAVESNKNRFWLIDQMLSPRFSDWRKYWYTLHREGLDKMFNAPEEGRQKILAGIPKLHQMNNANPSSILLQFFFNAKSDEMVKIISQVPKEQRAQYIPLLSQMDVPNTNKYQALK